MTSERLSQYLGILHDGWYGPLLAFAFFTLACLVLIPVTALTVAAGLTLDPFIGILVAWSGSITAAALGHVAGGLVWRESIRRLAGRRLNTLSRRLGQRGILSSALLRVVPVAPFMVVNLVAGASHVHLRDFIIGTALGMLPGTILLILAANGISTIFRSSPGPSWLWVGLAVLAFVGAAAALRRIAKRTLELQSRAPECVSF